MYTHKKAVKISTILIILLINSCKHRLTSEEDKHYQDNIRKSQKGISDWIKNNALYPNSYKPISFSKYSESYTAENDAKIPNTEIYVLKHIHNILDKDSNLTTFSGYFILEHDYSVNIIETTRSNSVGGAFPPETQIWMNKFGRTMTHQDTLELRQKYKDNYERNIKELKHELDEGTVSSEGSINANELKNILDTLNKKE
ncbi:hypothetical protein J0X19_08600 [Hymenobacter sp. BT186]|uniref:Uncharacterized protein n=1 Tax=Hymenobacter telluris TaxID=2816474 RepID=A0A939JAE1_9BACT|nr:hypothetical protein [Hymenobacter telluris]MBO0358001.1 hypothetical protein [Hymenobacter telluris]MBW3374028.1 hypothetical protein [Hymenobacter norwichensis]